MHFPIAGLFFGLWIMFCDHLIAFPVPWSENLVEEIDLLRASGISESDILSRYPRYLSVPFPPFDAHSVRYAATRPSNTCAPPHGRPSPFRQSVIDIFSKIGFKKPADDGDSDNALWAELVMDDDGSVYGKGRLKDSVGRRGEDLKRMG